MKKDSYDNFQLHFHKDNLLQLHFVEKEVVHISLLIQLSGYQHFKTHSLKFFYFFIFQKLT